MGESVSGGEHKRDSAQQVIKSYGNLTLTRLAPLAGLSQWERQEP